MDHPTDSQDELSRLKAIWNGIYSITCPDGVWSAYYLRTGEEVAAGSLPELRIRIRRDYERRLEVRPGAPERMSC